jgi:hypothetical protein
VLGQTRLVINCGRVHFSCDRASCAIIPKQIEAS